MWTVQYHMGRLLDLITIFLLPLEISSSVFTHHLLDNLQELKKQFQQGCQLIGLQQRMVDVFFIE